LKYSDGSRTPGYVSSEFLGDSKEGLDLSRAYTKKNRCTIGSTKVHAVGNIKQLKSFKQRPNQARIVYSAVKSIAWPFKSTLLYAQMIHIAIAGGNGPGGAAKGRIPNFKKKGGASGARLAGDRAYRRFGPNYGATRGFLVGSDIYE